MTGTIRRRIATLLVLAAGLPAAAAEPAARIVGTEMRPPPDSHEPQRAVVSLQNAGGPARGLGLACTFRDEGGSALAIVEAPVHEIGDGASAVVEVVYYGWPRASRVACRLAAGR